MRDPIHDRQVLDPNDPEQQSRIRRGICPYLHAQGEHPKQERPLTIDSGKADPYGHTIAFTVKCHWCGFERLLPTDDQTVKAILAREKAAHEHASQAGREAGRELADEIAETSGRYPANDPPSTNSDVAYFEQKIKQALGITPGDEACRAEDTSSWTVLEQYLAHRDAKVTTAMAKRIYKHLKAKLKAGGVDLDALALKWGQEDWDERAQLRGVYGDTAPWGDENSPGPVRPEPQPSVSSRVIVDGVGPVTFKAPTDLTALDIKPPGRMPLPERVAEYLTAHAVVDTSIAPQCPRCGGPGSLNHPCPYEYEVNHDPRGHCNCCDDCEQLCADDI